MLIFGLIAALLCVTVAVAPYLEINGTCNRTVCEQEGGAISLQCLSLHLPLFSLQQIWIDFGLLLATNLDLSRTPMFAASNFSYNS